MEAKDNIKRDADQIKRLEASKAAPSNHDSDASEKFQCKNKARTGVLPACKQQVKKNPKHRGSKTYCVLCKKAGMPEYKYKLHRSENRFEKVQQGIHQGMYGR